MKCLRAIWSWLKGLFFNQLPDQDCDYSNVVVCDDIPESVKQSTLYLVGEEHDFWALVFSCPCGCGEDIFLNLITDEKRPCWNVTLSDDQNVSVSPSIWRKRGCKSHFHLKASCINWSF